MNLRRIDPSDRKTKESLEHAVTQAEGLEYVLILGAKKGGGFWLRSSDISPMERRFLSGFLAAYCDAEDFPQDDFIEI